MLSKHHHTVEQLERLYQQARALLEGESDTIVQYANLSSLLFYGLSDINWVGFYRWDQDQQTLVLGPFQGKVACTRIAIGRGVCGRAALLGESVVVDDVHDFEGHIVCDVRSRSECVIPIFKHGQLQAVLDVDSDRNHHFDERLVDFLQRVARLLK